MPTPTSLTFERYTEDLIRSVAADAEVLGLVLVGSTADVSRVDEWSDHDLFLITVDGAQERFRLDLGWLPGADRLVLRVRETEHGLKAVYDDGRVVELAVFSVAELSLAQANSYRVALDRGGVTQVMAAIAGRAKPSHVVDVDREAALFLSLLLIGVGRARRGEVLAAGQHIRSHALAHLLMLWRALVPEPCPERLDDLDVFRRFELVYPEAGARVSETLAADPETCARGLLALAEEGLAGRWTQWPGAAADVLRRRLGW